MRKCEAVKPDPDILPDIPNILADQVCKINIKVNLILYLFLEVI